MRLDMDVGLLARASLFSGLSRDQLASLAFKSGRRRLRAGETLAAAGQPAHAAYLILEGRARCEVVGRDEPMLLEPGALIAELAMFVDTTYASTVVAETAMNTAVFARPQMIELLRQDRAMAAMFSLRVRERLLSLAVDLQAATERYLRDGETRDDADAEDGALEPPRHAAE